MAESESAAGVITTYYVLLLISLFSYYVKGFEVSESDFDPGTTERKVKKTPKKMHRSANDSGGQLHNTRVSIRNVLSASGTIRKGFGFV